MSAQVVARAAPSALMAADASAVQERVRISGRAALEGQDRHQDHRDVEEEEELLEGSMYIYFLEKQRAVVEPPSAPTI